MKRLTLLFSLLAIIFASYAAQAQESAEQNFLRYKQIRKVRGTNFQLTPFAGFNAMNYQENTLSVNGQDQNFGSDPENGSSVGFLLDYNTSFYGIALQTGLVFNRYLSSFNLVNQTNKFSFEYEDSYVTIPLNLKIYPFSRAGQWFYAKAGVNLGFLTESKENIREETLATNQVSRTTRNNMENKKQNDVQAVFGGGINIRLSEVLGLNLEGNYHHGLVDTRAQAAPEQNVPEFKTQGYSAIVGLSFYL